MGDLVLEFFVAYYEYGNLVKDSKKIASNYLFGNFVFDMLALLSFTIRFSLVTNHLTVGLLLYYLRIQKLIKIDD